MVTTSAAAQAGTIWVSRRVRVASQQLTSSGHHENNQRQRPPTFSPLLPVNPTIPSWLPPVFPSGLPEIRDSITQKIQEKYVNNSDVMQYHLSALNADVFWNRFSSLQELARLEDKNDILKVISTFQFISKKSIFLFSNFSRKIVANLPLYSAGELAAVIHAFAQLGFLEESMCLQSAQRIVSDIHNTDAQELVYIADGFASTRCYHTGVIEAILKHSRKLVSAFTVDQVSLFASSLARLNVRDERMFDSLGRRMLELTDVFAPRMEIAAPMLAIPEEPPVDSTGNLPCTARDVTLTAYAFAKMRVNMNKVFENKIVELSKILIRDFTAKELQMLTTAFDRWNLQDEVLFSAISEQTQRRMAQFSAESLVLLLKALINRSALDDALVARVVCHLPRLAFNMKTSDLVQFYPVLIEAKSETGFEALRAATVTKSGQFGPADWITILDSVTKTSTCTSADELIDAFVLVNAKPANYRETTNVVCQTVLERMSNQQLISLVSIAARLPKTSFELMNLIATSIETRTLNSNDSSDLYCLLVQMNCHENILFEKVMKNLFSNALAF